MWANHNKAWEADMSVETLVDPGAPREQVKDKYREVAVEPGGTFHFHTGRPLAARLGYDAALVDAMPDAGVESFAAAKTGATGTVVGIDMTEEMLAKSRATAAAMGLANAEFREGLLEDIPVEDGWADVVISNGVFNLCADKQQVFSEVFRILRPGGRLQFADIANGAPVPEGALHDIDLWTA
jgi:SAM-dependent methyltransferase